MMNQTMLIGRIVNDMSLTENNSLDIVLGVPRSVKDTDGNYSIDYIDCRLLNKLATNTIQHCKKGDLVAIKGHLEKEDIMFVNAERISFLASANAKNVM